MGRPPRLSRADRAVIQKNITDPGVLAGYIPPDKFEHYGFAVIRAVEVTESEVLSAIERDLIDQDNIFSVGGFNRLLNRLRVLFGRPHLAAGLAAVLEEEGKVLLVNSGCAEEGCKGGDCASALNPTEIPLDASQDSVFKRVYKTGELELIPDLAEISRSPLEEEYLQAGARSLMVLPLRYEDRIIGVMDITSSRADDLGPREALLARQIAPLFSVSLKRGLDDRERRVQAIIKEKCTAVHPSVEWRFSQAARTHLDSQRAGQASNLEPIVFKGVIPLFGQTDIRGSTEARNRAIQADLGEQLDLAREVFEWAGQARDWPLIRELEHRIGKRKEAVASSLASGDEKAVGNFLRLDIEPAFDDLAALGPRVAEAIETYRRALDPALGMIYHRRRQFEESVGLLNNRLSAYLDQEEEKAQAMFPHYFEKHQTDGLDYVIYLGASMNEKGRFSLFMLRNLGLWQFMTAAGMALLTEQLKPELKVPLQTCHLILINQSPLAIRFRYDEKRFDVDGAYDIRHEIIKSRLDKAQLKGGRERLTQPGRIAAVYSNPEEGREARRHIDYLLARGLVKDDLEVLELEDLPGVKGLRALRVGVELEPRNLEMSLGQALPAR